MTFRDRYMRDMAQFDELFDLTDEWNFSDTDLTLRAFLGLTEEEEDVWISDSDEALEELMESERRQRVLLVDLDDTLLNRKKELTKGNENSIRKMLAAGHVFSFATGRPLFWTEQFAKDLGLAAERCYAIGFNGAQIKDMATGDMLVSRTVPQDVIAVCEACAKEIGVHIQGYSDHAVIVNSFNKNTEYYSTVMIVPVEKTDSIAAFLPQGSPKMLAMDIENPEKTFAFRNILQEKIGDQVDLFHSSPFMLEIVPKGINKGTAVEALCSHLALPTEHSIAAGDNENDISMIRAAGKGCAMANAIEAAKQAADYITEADCDHDGVAEIIQKFILNT